MRRAPAAGLKVDLCRIEDEIRTHPATHVTNGVGGTDDAIPPRNSLCPPLASFSSTLAPGSTPPESPRLLDVIPLRFGISEAAHHKLPFLLSPFGSSTYRGS